MIKAGSGHPDAAQMRTDLIIELPEPSGVRVRSGLATSKSEAALVPSMPKPTKATCWCLHRPLQGDVTAISNRGAALVAVRGETEAMSGWKPWEVKPEAASWAQASKSCGTTASRFKGVMNEGTWMITVRATEANDFHAIPNPEFTAFHFDTP